MLFCWLQIAMGCKFHFHFSCWDWKHIRIARIAQKTLISDLKLSIKIRININKLFEDSWFARNFRSQKTWLTALYLSGILNSEGQPVQIGIVLILANLGRHQTWVSFFTFLNSLLFPSGFNFYTQLLQQQSCASKVQT
jgi:hypothetical protein